MSDCENENKGAADEKAECSKEELGDAVKQLLEGLASIRDKVEAAGDQGQLPAGDGPNAEGGEVTAGWVHAELTYVRYWLSEQAYRMYSGYGGCGPYSEVSRKRVAAVYSALVDVIGEMEPSLMKASLEDPTGEKYGVGVSLDILRPKDLAKRFKKETSDPGEAN